VPLDLEYKVTGSRDFNYRVTTNQSFIKLGVNQGNTKEKKFSFTILGRSLVPWEKNQAWIQFKFPSYPALDKLFYVNVEAKGNTVKVRIEGTYATVNDQQIMLEPGMSPILKNNRTFVGLRFMNDLVFKKLSTISYDSKTQTVLLVLNDKKIELRINQPYAFVNGEKVELDVPPFISSGRTYVPLRFISENLDATIEYDASISEITIYYPKKNR
jgi:hypothetical protein